LSFQFKKPIQFRTQYFYIYYLSKAITNLNIHYSVFLPEFFFEPIRFQTKIILKKRAGGRRKHIELFSVNDNDDHAMPLWRRRGRGREAVMDEKRRSNTLTRKRSPILLFFIKTYIKF
jgi:hypothetical protein